MKVSFGRTSGGPTGRNRVPAEPGGRAQALLGFSDDLLARHRAAVLEPRSAVLLAGQRRPLSTVYRLDVLLVPQDLWTPAGLQALNAALAPIGIYLTVSDRTSESPQPRPVRIRVLPGTPPTAVDAWVVLQTLRAAAAAGKLDASTVARIGLDHLLCGSAFAGADAVAMFGENMPTEGSGFDGATAYGRTGYSGLTPVALAMQPPARHKVVDGGRRPVVVVLDSGVAEHPWFAPGNLSVRTSVQNAVIAASTAANDEDEPAITTPTDGRAIDDPMIGSLTSHFGHGTFIAGIIRQTGPDADIESVRVMHSDGIAYESDVLCALATLATEVKAWRAGAESVPPVDVVSLSLGYFDEDPDPGTAAIAAAIGELTALGVMVVAAAGNFATRRPFLPAALAAQLDQPDRAPMLAVGALNPNGTVALFSDDGPWVSCFATGVSLISTYPVTAQGSATAANRVPGLYRESLDTDDFTGGFAMWSGTSFAVPVVAGHLARALGVVAAAGSTQDAIAGARAALDIIVAEAAS